MAMSAPVHSHHPNRQWITDTRTSDTRTGLSLFIFILLIVGSILYYYALKELYLNVVYPTYAYYGLVLELKPDREPAALFFVVVFVLILPRSYKLPSDLLRCTVVLLWALPSTVLLVCADLSWTHFSIIALITTALTFVDKLPDITLRLPEIDINVLCLVLLAASATSTLASMNILGFSHFSLALLDVYDRRAFAFENLQGGIAYLIQLGRYSIAANMVLGLFYKKYLYVALAFLLAFMDFGLIGHKSQILLPPVILFLFTFMRMPAFWNILIFGLFGFAMLCAYVLASYATGEAIIHSTFRRISFIPTWLDTVYLDYYSAHGFLYWSYSKLSFGFVNYSDVFEPSTAIGFYLNKTGETHANTGLIGSGYMNAGYYGIFFYGMLIVLFTKLTNIISKQKNAVILVTLILVPSLCGTIFSTDLPGAFLSGGLGLQLLVIALVPSVQNNSGRNRSRLRTATPNEIYWRNDGVPSLGRHQKFNPPGQYRGS
jgi:hypothetical protein